MFFYLEAHTLTYRRRTKANKNFVGAIYGRAQIDAGHEYLEQLRCYLNMPDSMLSNNCQTY